MPVERSAGIILFRTTPDGRRYLVLRSSRGESTVAKGKTVKEFWDFPKGRLEKGETGLEAARREASEEAGVTEAAIVPDFKETVHYFTWRSGKPVPKYVALFLAEAPSEDVTLSWEHDKYEWLPFKEAEERLLKPMREALGKAETFLSKGN